MNNILHHQYKTKGEFLKDVMDEIKNIKKYATQDEINRLDYNIFDPNNRDKCIYGLMTGKRNSYRAMELYPKQFESMVPKYMTFKDANNRHRYLRKYDKLNSFIHAFSALEVYGPMKGAKNESIFQYLKGEKESLTL